VGFDVEVAGGDEQLVGEVDLAEGADELFDELVAFRPRPEIEVGPGDGDGGDVGAVCSLDDVELWIDAVDPGVVARVGCIFPQADVAWVGREILDEVG
jgi:hypothetical protein